MSLSISDVKLNLWADRYKTSEIAINKSESVGKQEKLVVNKKITETSLFRASKIGDAFITLEWNNILGAASYKLTRASDNNFKHNVSITTLDTLTSFTDTGVTPDKTYYYKLDGVFSNSAGQNAAEVIEVRTLQALSAPGEFKVTNIDDTNVDLTWNTVFSNFGSITYTVQQSMTQDFAITKKIYSGQLPTCVPIDLLPSTQYYFGIFATDETHIYPVYSNISVMTAANLSTPTIPIATVVTPNDITITWTNNDTRVTGYILEKSLTGGDTFLTKQAMYTGPLTTFTDTGLITNTTYYYRVTATKLGFTIQTSPVCIVKTA